MYARTFIAHRNRQPLRSGLDGYSDSFCGIIAVAVEDGVDGSFPNGDCDSAAGLLVETGAESGVEDRMFGFVHAGQGGGEDVGNLGFSHRAVSLSPAQRA